MNKEIEFKKLSDQEQYIFMLQDAIENLVGVLASGGYYTGENVPILDEYLYLAGRTKQFKN